jgi:SAM-dependent methyltransferase
VLPNPPARVLDVGGGTGVHAAWLAGRGYDVELIDLVSEHVRRASEAAAMRPQSFSARTGDARALDAAGDAYDATLLLGPLYHLTAAADRARALAETRRVTRPRGVVAVAAISRLAWPLYAVRDGVAITPDRAEAIRETMATGIGDPHGNLPSAYSHTPAQLVGELEARGFDDIEIVGIEGPAWTSLRPGLPAGESERLLATALEVARLTSGQNDIAATSAHLLAVAIA